MERLIEGFLRFRSHSFQEQRGRFARLSERGQRPRYAVVTCCDSRIDTTLLFDAVPGEIFVIRNVANLVPPYQPDERAHATSAALEYAVRSLQVAQIVVLGHAHCGGIQALLDPPEQGTDFIEQWMQIAAPARERVLGRQDVRTPDARQRQCELEALKDSRTNLLGFPWVAKREQAGGVAVDALYVDLGAGELHLYEPARDRFERV